MPVARRPRATIAASEIISLSLSRGVRFIVLLRPRRRSARPHLWQPKRTLLPRALELQQNLPQIRFQLRPIARPEARDHEPGHYGHEAVTPQLGSQLAQELDLRRRIRAEIDERTDRLEVGEQCPASKPRQHVVRGTKAIRPDETAVQPYLPAIGNLSADDLLAMSRSTEHEPFESKQL